MKVVLHGMTEEKIHTKKVQKIFKIINLLQKVISKVRYDIFK